jgi:hypothetical protein
MSVLGTTVFKVPKLGETGFKSMSKSVSRHNNSFKKKLTVLVLKRHTWITPWDLLASTNK